MKNVVGVRARFVSAVVLSTLAAFGSRASAQDSKWGAEGRLSGNQAFLIRWLSPEWSLVMGGGFTLTSSGNSNNETRFTNGSAQFMLRKESNRGAFHPFFGIGPSYTLTRNENESISGTPGKTTNTTHGIAARLEIGGLYDVHSHIALGIVGGATAGVNISKVSSTVPPPTGLNSSSTNGPQGSIGNLQFVMRVRF